MDARKTFQYMQFLFLLIPPLAPAIPACAGIPGSAIVFPKFITGTVSVDGVTTPATEIAVRAVCPLGITCPEGEQTRVRAEWVCPGSATNAICRGTGFEFIISVNGTVAFDPQNIPILGADPVVFPVPECPRGYLIMYAIDDSGQPIKYDGLGGNAILRETGTAASGYTAALINADPALASGALISLGPDGALIFDGGPGHYQQLASSVRGQLEFTRTTGPVPPGGYPTASITLLTLDVRSNQPNSATFVPLDFFNEDGRRISTSAEFVCWTEQRVDAIDPNLTFEAMGTRAGFVLAGPAEQVSPLGTSEVITPATLMGLMEITEGTTPGSAEREAITTLTLNPPLASTNFIP
jgi:hypothetical protein